MFGSLTHCVLNGGELTAGQEVRVKVDHDKSPVVGLRTTNEHQPLSWARGHAQVHQVVLREGEGEGEGGMGEGERESSIYHGDVSNFENKSKKNNSSVKHSKYFARYKAIACFPTAQRTRQGRGQGQGVEV